VWGSALAQDGGFAPGVGPVEALGPASCTRR
jgi:hypothetical protein